VAWCCHHIKENFVALFGRGLAPEFWAIARAKTMPVYEEALEKLRRLKPEAATYFEAASPENWVEVLFRGRRYGHDTSNVVENTSFQHTRKRHCVEASIPRINRQ
jgi:hypothetical protein